ncbi:MAG: hypothetical protein ACKV2V_22485 [Blastocatellia bacterium]
MKIYDCFPFNNELDVLEVRLNELYPVIDRFVLVEASRTHAGQPKPMHFQEHRARFAPFSDKLAYVPVDDMPDGGDAWVRENFQRNCIARGLTDLRDEDLVLVSDADEIPRHEVVAALRQYSHDLFGQRLPMFYYRFNYFNHAGTEPHQVWSIGVRGRKFHSGQSARELAYNMAGVKNWLQVKRRKGRIIPEAGWHFSWLGDESHVIYKHQSYAHQEQYDPALMARLNIERLIAAGSDHLDAGRAWTIVEIDDYFPRHLVENYARFSRLIAPGATHNMSDFRLRLAWEANPLSRFGRVQGRKIRELMASWKGKV